MSEPLASRLGDDGPILEQADFGPLGSGDGKPNQFEGAETDFIPLDGLVFRIEGGEEDLALSTEGGEAEAGSVADQVVSYEAVTSPERVQNLLFGPAKFLRERFLQQEVGANGAEEIAIGKDRAA